MRCLYQLFGVVTFSWCTMLCCSVAVRLHRWELPWPDQYCRYRQMEIGSFAHRPVVCTSLSRDTLHSFGPWGASVQRLGLIADRCDAARGPGTGTGSSPRFCMWCAVASARRWRSTVRLWRWILAPTRRRGEHPAGGTPTLEGLNDRGSPMPVAVRPSSSGPNVRISELVFLAGNPRPPGGHPQRGLAPTARGRKAAVSGAFYHANDAAQTLVFISDGHRIIRRTMHRTQRMRLTGGGPEGNTGRKDISWLTGLYRPRSASERRRWAGRKVIGGGWSMMLVMMWEGDAVLFGGCCVALLVDIVQNPVPPAADNMTSPLARVIHGSRKSLQRG